MTRKAFTRRRFVATSTAATAALIAAPYVHTAQAAGKLSIGFWDHWVPGANDTSRTISMEWAAREKVDLSIDYITSQGEKQRMTIAAESQARSGHDIMQMGSWWPTAYADNLERVDDIMPELIKLNGAVNPTVYLDAWRRLQDVRFDAVAGWAPALAANAPKAGAILLQSSDISTASGLDPSSLKRALAPSAQEGEGGLLRPSSQPPASKPVLGVSG